ncbi:MAG TPA: Flp pilus assembly protein CpaB [Acidimicrobiales bacterium]|jgi:pilus assembly protein CpaB|nr:Flp pilus assembly protein CpaB [Acidimicrobiales bacterium]
MGSVKKQTLILVLIGVILFVAGSAIAYASVQGVKKNTNANSPTTQAPVSTSAVVATSDIPVGTTGQAMISQHLVALKLIPTKSYVPTDLTSVQSLPDEVLTAPIQKGQAISSTELTASSTAISIPKGMDAMTVNITGAGGLAGYLQPGGHVDVYGNITHTTAGSTLPTPCTELAMADVQVLDVSSTSPDLAASKGGRTVPGSETLLLALTPGQSQTLQFLVQNEGIAVVQTQDGAVPPVIGQCIGTDQTSTAP